MRGQRATGPGAAPNTVEDGVGEGGLVDHGMPGVDGELAGDDGRARLVAVLDNLHEVPALAGGGSVGAPVVEE